VDQDSSPPSPHETRRFTAAFVTGLAYATVGALALLLAGPPGYASPLYPSAGIGLAAVLTWGRAAAPGVFLGAFAVSLIASLLRGQSGLILLLLPALVALGATLQALAGAALLRRFTGPAVVLQAPRDIVLAGLLGGLLACTISPSVATPSLVGLGVVPPAGAASTWFTWWLGDTLGVLIAAPLVLSFIGKPSAAWRSRRRTVGLPLLLALGLLAVAVQETGRLDRLRQQAVFARDAERLGAEIQTRLNAALHALQALHGAAGVQGTLDAAGLRSASQWWLAQPIHLQAAGHSVRVPLAELAVFEAQAQAQGLTDYRVFDRDQGHDRASRAEVLAIRHIEPLAGNEAALGVNALSIPQARAAILASRASGQPAATAAFKLTQSLPRSGPDESGLVVYQALYRGAAAPASVAEREAQFSAVVFVTLRADQALADLAQGSVVQWCLTDSDADAERKRLSGTANCEAHLASPRELAHQQTIAFAGRSWQLRTWATAAGLPSGQREASWLMALAGMLPVALLAALLLTITGQAQRTHQAVHAGTEVLRSEVAEREQVEAALRGSGAQLRSILDSVPLGVVLLDPRGLLIECNPRFCEMTGTDAAELLGRSVVDWIHPEDWKTLREARGRLMKSSLRSAAESVRLRAGPDRYTTVRMIASALRDPNGSVLRLVALMEDITEHLRLEESERALARAEAANRAKSEFLSLMSHELRTPLNAMIGFAQLMGLDREMPLQPRQQEWTQQIQRAGWHLLELINDTLDLARIESGAVQLAPVALELAPLVSACKAMLTGAADQRQVSISEKLAPDCPAVLADPTRLRQVLTNLLSNAVKYNREGGQVLVSSTSPEPGRVRIEVSDTGLGMSDSQLSALFQPYNRLGREQTAIEGTGIGLVISRRLTELMGGTLDVSSRTGAGSTFTLTLPAAAHAPLSALAGAEEAPAPYQHRRVHYIEDNETNIEVMRGVLAQRAQVRLTVSTLGLDGLSAVRDKRPDLILLDMQLPDISGLELLRHLKQDDDVADIPVIVVSADATTANMQAALTLGAKHYVTKPLALASFLRLVDDALEAAETRF
jgi:PAS domain S-box-containing protein